MNAVQNANIGPVFLTFRDKQKEIQSKMAYLSHKIEPYIEVKSDDGVQHVLWRLPVDEAINFEKQFEDVRTLYVADGHHRSAAAYNVGKERRDEAIRKGFAITGEEPFNYFMSILYPSNNLLIMDYNRVIKSLNGMDTPQFMQALARICKVTQLAEKGSPPKGTFNLLIDDHWYNLEPLQKVHGIDSQVLTDVILGPVLGIKNLKEDPRIDFVGGIRGLGELEKRCKVDCKAAFALHPVTVDELIEVADAGNIMPPKSTWFEPKPRAGFVVRMFEESNQDDKAEVLYETATFGAGCFWCVEAVLQQIPGVISMTSGYMGGHVKNPTYRQICEGDTGHAEVVQVRFDPSVISYTQLLEWFWKLHDPTTIDQQGNDVGPQYRSVIFFHSDEQREAAKRSKVEA